MYHVALLIWSVFIFEQKLNMNICGTIIVIWTSNFCDLSDKINLYQLPAASAYNLLTTKIISIIHNLT